MDELTAIAHEPRALDPEVLADVPPGALAQWQEIGAGLGHIGGMLAQVMGRAVLPRTIAVGEALNSLRNTHYKHHGDRLRFVAHAEALIGLKSRQAQKLEAFGKHRRLLQEYVEQHGLKPTSLLAMEHALRHAKAEARRIRLGGEPDQWADGVLVGPDAPKQLVAGDQAGGAKGRHKGIQALKAAAAQLWQWSSDEAVGSRPGLRERVEKVAQAVEVVLQQIESAINSETGIPGTEHTQLDLVEDTAHPMPVVITAADPEQGPNAEDAAACPAGDCALLADGGRLLQVEQGPNAEVLGKCENLPAAAITSEAQVPAAGTTRRRNPIGVVTKRADTPAEAFPATAEGLALLLGDIDRAGGQQALGEVYDVKRQAIGGLVTYRRKQLAKLQDQAEVVA